MFKIFGGSRSVSPVIEQKAAAGLSGKVLVTVYDTVSQIYFNPFVAHNDADAVRQLAAAVRQPGPINEFFDNYRFYVIGEWFPETGVVSAVPHRALSVPVPPKVANA